MPPILRPRQSDLRLRELEILGSEWLALKLATAQQAAFAAESYE